MTTPAPLGTTPPAGRRNRVAWGTGVLLAAALTYIGLVDPHNPNSFFPVCPFRLLTGWNCPGCGALRMIHDVLHGDLAAAVADNVVLLVGVPLLAGWALLRHRRGKSPLTIPATAAILCTLLAWTVVRNLPGFPLVPTLLAR
ncbi:DUF2752 domain-containing protein [Mycobacterium cookii]|uniref:DUF2752 domain-containing protein n=1 Tax=Mycobacterium cookii TaxID=1775 RepID=A0A7I7KS89_9MYCO|nr:DUF2752 domain-containing protein [Mycobacterium cookii]MCV7332132.1 DUF2752 domain-containing protein [Mycobacterium cookii]BBX44609.1 hypothetical protein MCOO_06240 [Mycobacterium cookii]